MVAAPSVVLGMPSMNRRSFIYVGGAKRVFCNFFSLQNLL
jgi:hypothetical protein